MWAQTTVVWGNTGASTAWYTNTNWTPNTAFGAWTTSYIAQFQDAGTATSAGINTGTANLSIGAIEITSARTRSLSIGSSVATSGTLTLNGTTVNSIANTIIRNNSGFNLTIQDNGGAAGPLGIVLANTTANIVNIDGAGSVQFSSIVSGTGKLVKGGSGAGALILSGINTYSGGTDINAGTVNIPSGNAIFGTGTLTINGGILNNTSGSNSLNVGGNPAQVWGGDFTFTGTNSMNMGTGAVSLTGNRTVTVSANTLTIGGIVSSTGAFGIIKAGTGTIAMAGVSTYTGATTINAGTLQLTNGNTRLPTTTAMTIASGATFDMNTRTQTIGSLAGAGSVTNATTLATLTVGDATSTTFSGIIAGGSVLALTKQGSGTLTLTGANTYTGATTVNAGILLLNRTGGTTLPVGNSITVASGATLRISTPQQLANVTVNTGGTLIVDATLTMTGTATINGTFQINPSGYATGGTWTYGASSTLIYNNATGSYGFDNSHVYWPSSAGPVNVTVAGAGGLTVGAARTVSGVFQTAAAVTTANNLTANGTLQINAGGSLSGTPTYGASSILVYNTAAYTTTTNEFPASGVKNVTITAPSGTNTVTLDGDKTITGTLIVGTHTLNGGKSINAATITIGTGSMVMGDITTSTAFTCSGASSVSLSGAWNVTSFTKSTSTVTFTNNGGINNVTNFYNLTNSGGTRNITQNINVENTLLVSGGQMGVTGGSARTLTMSGATATVNIAGGSIYGTDAGTSNDLTLIVSGAQTTLTGNATGSNDDEKKFFSITVNSSSTLILARGILCKYGAFTVNGTLQINANGYVQNASSYGSNAKTPLYNASTGA